MKEWIVINGDITTGGAISIDDRGYTLGDGLFETVPLYKGRPFKLEYHFDRLKEGAKRIKLKLPLDESQMRDATRRLAERNSIETGAVRLTVTRGKGPRGYGIEGCDSPVWALTCRQYTPVSGEKREKGFRLEPVSIRIDPRSPLRGLKTVSSLESIMIYDQARRLEADEAMTLTVDGHIASCAAANIFWVRDGRLETPSLSCGVLPGVTRRIVLELAGEIGIEADEGRFGTEAIEEADEVFITNSLLTVVPVAKITGLFSAASPGPVTRKLYSRYSDLTGA